MELPNFLQLIVKISLKYFLFQEESPIDGWEYAFMFSGRFHARERRVDTVRRRRWRRKLVPSEPGLPPTPRLIVKSKGEPIYLYLY